MRPVQSPHHGSVVLGASSFSSLDELRHEIIRYLAEYNEHPKPFKWTARGEDILEKIGRAKAKLEKVEKDVK